MIRGLTILAVALAVVAVGSHAAFAGLPNGGNILCELLPFLCGGHGNPGPSPAPAPLLAAGIPAFTALGGGVLVSRVMRKFKRA